MAAPESPRIARAGTLLQDSLIGSRKKRLGQKGRRAYRAQAIERARLLDHLFHFPHDLRRCPHTSSRQILLRWRARGWRNEIAVLLWRGPLRRRSPDRGEGLVSQAIRAIRVPPGR